MNIENVVSLVAHAAARDETELTRLKRANEALLEAAESMKDWLLNNQDGQGGNAPYRKLCLAIAKAKETTS